MAELVYLSYVAPRRPSTPVVAAPDPNVTCAPSKLDLRVITCSDGRAFRFDWEALRAFLAQPRLHLLAGRQLRSGDRIGEEPCRAVQARRSAPQSFRARACPQRHGAIPQALPSRCSPIIASIERDPPRSGPRRILSEVTAVRL
jgi:hypothetical protein